MSLSSAVIDPNTLTSEQKRQMYAILDGHYLAVSRDRFEADLSDKDLAILISDGDGVIQGFSTVRRSRLDDPAVRLLFSGDTVIDRRHWGTQALAVAWLRMAAAEKTREPQTPLFWLLITKGPRTYRYLSSFALRYWPCHGQPMPDQMRQLRDRIASRWFGPAYDPNRGVVRWPESRGHLRPDLAAVEGTDRRPDVTFFLQANPGYRNGDELVCLSEVAADNLKPFARRIFVGGQAADASRLAITS